mmetsp:Transcript_72939/g.211139  ORF Transcript_72939/g.211139 Transcript_72939/m.211139 type:complete len:202 (+) Transcript_72939:2489-3094(+)
MTSHPHSVLRVLVELALDLEDGCGVELVRGAVDLHVAVAVGAPCRGRIGADLEFRLDLPRAGLRGENSGLLGNRRASAQLVDDSARAGTCRRVGEAAGPGDPELVVPRVWEIRGAHRARAVDDHLEVAGLRRPNPVQGGLMRLLGQGDLAHAEAEALANVLSLVEGDVFARVSRVAAHLLSLELGARAIVTLVAEAMLPTL